MNSWRNFNLFIFIIVFTVQIGFHLLFPMPMEDRIFGLVAFGLIYPVAHFGFYKGGRFIIRKIINAN